MDPPRALSFSHAPRQQEHGNAPQQQTQHAAGAQLPRPSPFASSGPVAMVNQMRPGAPGQFPGVAVRTNPTQLSTPLGPARRPSTTPTGTDSEVGARDAQFPPARAPQSAHGAASPQFFPPGQTNQSQQQQYQQQQHTDPFQGNDLIPAFQMQAASQASIDLFPRVDRASADTLLGSAPGSSSSSRSQSQTYDSLFGSTDLSSSAPPLSAPVRSTQSFSYGQTSQAHYAQDDQQSRSFGQAPPPAAPFLGYADPSRSQSFRGQAPSPAELRNTATPSRPGLPQRSSNSSLPMASPPRLHAGARSADELLEEFLRVSIEDQYLLDSSAPTTFPGYTGSIVPPAKKLTLADVPDTVDSLEELYRQKRWKTLTKKSLSMLQSPSNDAQLTLEIKSWWLAGLIKEGHYDNATSVLDQIGDLDDPAYSTGSGGNPGDSFVSLRLRLLEAMLSKYKGNIGDHEKKLFQLIAKIKGAQAQAMESSTLGCSPEAAWKWLRIAQFALVNHLVHQNKFSLAVRVSATIDTEHLQEYERVIVLSRLGRLHLQMGDLGRAESLFALARSTTDSAVARQAPGCCGSDGAVAAQLQGRLLLNDGLLLFAQNKLQESLSAFDSILHLETSRISAHDQLLHHHEVGSSEEELLLEEDLICVAVNNYAICALYCCDVNGAVAALERMIRSNPARFLNAVVVFNLSSLYDLIFDNVTSTSRKEMMKKLAELYDLEHIDPAAFRI